MPAGAIDLILLGVILEAIVLLGLRLRTGHGVPPGSLLANLAAGASLMLALRLALAGGGSFAWLPLCLAMALLAHVADLALRWERRRHDSAFDDPS
jgi:hypothetical protein